MLGLTLRNVHCAQAVLQLKFNNSFIPISLQRYVSKYINRFEPYLELNKCILNVYIFY